MQNTYHFFPVIVRLMTHVNSTQKIQTLFISLGINIDNLTGTVLLFSKGNRYFILF